MPVGYPPDLDPAIAVLVAVAITMTVPIWAGDIDGLPGVTAMQLASVPILIALPGF